MSDRSQAMYVGTFDPLTNGHFDIITRASKLFDSLVIGIGHNHDKQMLFTPEQREEMIVETCTHLPNVRTTKFSGLAVEHALAEGITIMIRGLRTEADYTYEMQMAMMNKSLDENLETIFIPTRQSLSHVSSSLVKEVAQMKGNVSSMVPKVVFKQIKTIVP